MLLCPNDAFEPVQESRNQALRAYCPYIYIVNSVAIAKSDRTEEVSVFMRYLDFSQKETDLNKLFVFV